LPFTSIAFYPKRFLYPNPAQLTFFPFLLQNYTWDKVDLKNRLIELEATDTKDREPRIISICDKLYEVLKGMPRAIHDPHVFLYKGKPIRDLRTALR
jgi:integrase